MTQERTAREFESYRKLLFSIAYRMLGSVADAEDVVQDASVRWQSVERGTVRSPKSFLTSVVTRLCIDQLRAPRAWREEALPEPIASEHWAGSREDRDLADSLSLAFLVMLQKLTAVERAVFLLREVFDYDYADVAAVVGKSETNCRQIVRRSKKRLAQGEERFKPSGDEVARVVSAFQSVLAGGDVEGLVKLLSPDVTLYADGGAERPHYGKARAIRRPLQGAELVAKFLVSVQAQAPDEVVTRIETVNGEPALLAYRDGELMAVLSFEVVEGRIRNLFIQQDPEKRSGMGKLRFDP